VMSATTFYAFGVWELPTYMQKSVALLFTAQSVMVVLLFIIVRGAYLCLRAVSMVYRLIFKCVCVCVDNVS
jgi:hypothetical protein